MTREPTCEHSPRMRVTAGAFDGVHSSTYVCARPACIEDAKQWARESTGGKEPEVVALPGEPVEPVEPVDRSDAVLDAVVRVIEHEEWRSSESEYGTDGDLYWPLLSRGEITPVVNRILSLLLDHGWQGPLCKGRAERSYWLCDVPGGCMNCRRLARGMHDTERLAEWDRAREALRRGRRLL